MPKGKLRKLLYNRWRHIVARCQCKLSEDFVRYGGRGIRVFGDWLGPRGFANFFEHIVNTMPIPPGMSLAAVLTTTGTKKLTLDRIDNERGYEPGNLRWATPTEQSANQRRTSYVDVNGSNVPRTWAARSFGVAPKTAAHREKCGYTPYEAASLPIGGRTAETRQRRDAVILAMIEAGELFVTKDGFVLVRDADGWFPAPLGSSKGGRYWGVSISIPRALHHLVSADEREAPGAYRSMFPHARLVALFHHPLPQDGRYYEADHINMDTHDDRPENLRWQCPEEHRANAHRGRECAAPVAIDYTNPGLQEAALQEVVALTASATDLSVMVEEEVLPDNAPTEAHRALITLVKADPGFSGSMWAKDEYAALLPMMLAASANGASVSADRVTIVRQRQVGQTIERVYVTDLRVADRVYFGCPSCGRQAFATRTEIRNRVRYADTACESCIALDLVWPELAAMIAGDPFDAIKRHPSRITAGSNENCMFHCRVERCPNLVKRKVKTLVARRELPVCTAHRRRGKNFG